MAEVTLEEALLLATSGVGSLVWPETFGAVMGCCIADCWAQALFRASRS